MRKGSGVLLAFITALVSGCTSQASQYNNDIVNSVAGCKGQSFRTQVNRVQCYNLAERPVILRDLPNLLPAFDIWHVARLSAASDYDNEVGSIQARFTAPLKIKTDAASTRLNQATIGVWPEAQKDKDSLKQESEKASLQCRRNGIWKTTSMVANFKCEQDARQPILERRVPAATNSLRAFYDERLTAASEYDKGVLPIIQAASAKFGTTIIPAQNAFRSEVKLALQNDAAATARQQREIGDLLSVLLQVGVAGAEAHKVSSQPAPMISTSCTTNRGITNCSSF